jgi:predicted DNA-binding transcriptional regulator AlpA
MGKRILRPAESQGRLGIGHTRFYEWMRNGTYGLTRPVRLGPQSIGHPEDEIDAVVDRIIAERDNAATGNKLPRRKQAVSKK